MASIQKRPNGRWRAVVSTRDIHGNRQQKSKIFDLKKEAVEWVASIESKTTQGFSLTGGDVSFMDFMKFWSETYKMPKLRKSSFIRMTYEIKSLERYFGKMQLNKLTADFMQQAINKYGENYSYNSCKHVTRMVKEALRSALGDGRIHRDFFSNIEIPGHATRQQESTWLSATEFEKLRDYLYDMPYGLLQEHNMAILVSLETGARIGEVMALTPKALDVEKLTLSIHQSYSAVGDEVTPTKTKSSNRVVQISKRLALALNEYFEYHSNQELFAKSPRSAAQHVFRTLDKHTIELGIVRVKVHELRHSHLSYLLYKDVPIEYVSKRAGHSNIATTMSIYAHMLHEREQAENNRIDSLFE